MDAEGEETSEIAIKRMTKQKKEKKKKGGRNRRRGDPVVINGTRSMRKHYVIDEESGASVRAPFSNLPLQFHSTDFPRGGRHLGLLKTAQKREEARLLAGETHEILRGRTRFKTLNFAKRGFGLTARTCYAPLSYRTIVKSSRVKAGNSV